jgi:trans-aconitate 2-methyltransferase
MTSEVPEYDTLARDWEQLEDLLRPVAEAVVERLPTPADGAFVLDMGCGAGEPGLTVKAHHPAVRLLGVDRAELMVEVARSKARRLGLSDVTFEVGLMSDTAVESASVDMLVSRFSFLMLDHQNLESSLSEATRVLRPGAAYSFAVWDRSELNTLIALFRSALSGFPGTEGLPDPSAVDYLAEPGYRAGLLRRAGLDTVDEAAFHWDYLLADQQAVFEVLSQSPSGAFLKTLQPDDRAEIEARMTHLATEYRMSDGSYRFPTTCRLFWGRR